VLDEMAGTDTKKKPGHLVHNKGGPAILLVKTRGFPSLLHSRFGALFSYCTSAIIGKQYMRRKALL